MFFFKKHYRNKILKRIKKVYLFKYSLNFTGLSFDFIFIKILNYYNYKMIKFMCFNKFK